MPTIEYLTYQGLDEDHGTLDVNEGEYILEAANAQGFDWAIGDLSTI